MMDLSSFHSQFHDETVENIRALTSSLIALEATSNAAERRAHVDRMFRAMHTIKGSARVLGCEDIGRLAHACEHMLSAVREGQREFTRALADDLLRGGDALQEMVQALVQRRPSNVDVDSVVRAFSSQPDAAPSAPVVPVETPTTSERDTPAPARSHNARQTIRVRVDRLDRLLNLAGELAVTQQSHVSHLQAIEEAKRMLTRQQRMLVLLDAELARLRLSATQRDALNQHINTIMSCGDGAAKLLRGQIEQFAQHATHNGQLLEDLEQEVMATRLLPVSVLYTHLPRLVRTITHESGKDIALTLKGETTELDRKIIEALNDPLLHIIRNAVDHGIEHPDEREQQGKPRQGTISVQAQALGAHVQIAISDDGRGIDPQVLRQSVVRKALLSAEAAAQLTDQEALELIFTPGFSTAPMITDLSGRGVGMDIVRTNITEVGGQVLLESYIGHGTTITLLLPLTLVTTRVLLVEAGGQAFALPASACQGTVWTVLDQVPTVEGRPMLHHEDQLVPLYHLANVLGLPHAHAPEGHRRAPTVLAGTVQRPIALLVDRLLDEREVVIKSIGPLFEQQRLYGGATQLGDGSLVLLLNIVSVAQAARASTSSTLATKQQPVLQPARLLVTDDSFTTRELIRSILQAAGYHVTTAIDGHDALEKLRVGTYDLVVSDVEMPRVDGFTLTERIRKELKNTTVPVIIITSLASDAHRRRGLEAGAQAYIVKSQFNQGNLLETVRQLLGR